MVAESTLKEISGAGTPYEIEDGSAGVNAGVVGLEKVAGVTSGAETTGAADTEMVADWLADPPLLEQVMMYVEAEVGETEMLPLVPLVPDQAPDAKQVVALVVDHVRVAALPSVMDEGEAVRVTVGRVTVG